MATIALSNALTAIFGATNYTQSSSGIGSKKIPVTESDGLPSGQIGMAALAAVLLNPNNNDFNSLGLDINSDSIPFGFYSLYGYEVDHPEKVPYTPSASNRGVLLNIPLYAQNKRMQIIFLLGASRIYGRYYQSSNNPWGAWKYVEFTT